MILPDDVRCLICAKVFCCTTCREKHENKIHSGEKKRRTCVQDTLCPICQEKGLALQPGISSDLLQHIVKQHLPLRCKKCSKIYETEENLLKTSSCIKLRNLGVNENIEITKGIVDKHLISVQKASCSTQTSPLPEKSPSKDVNALTPMSLINGVEWKAIINKISDSCVSDCFSSVRNVSSFGNLSKQAIKIEKKIEKGGLVRTTSTPMQVLLPKSKDNVFDSSEYQVSSIYASGSESDVSPSVGLFRSPANTDYPKSVELVNESRSEIKRKMIIATPLRQVISKSIQKAIAKHNANEYHETSRSNNSKGVLDRIVGGSPLDLRTSPALRRSKSEIIQGDSVSIQKKSSSINRRKEILYSSQKLTTTHSVLVSSSSRNLEDKKVDTVYKTCSSVEFFTTEINEIDIKASSSENQSSLLVTPKIPAAPIKKLISFETPNFPEGTPESLEDEVFYTPSTTPTRSLKTSLSKLKTHGQRMPRNEKSHATILCKQNSEPIQGKQSRSSRLWSMVSSVIRLPSLTGNNDKSQDKHSQESLIKRCSSFAGTLTQPLISDDQQLLKRKRTLSSDGCVTNFISNISEAPPKRIKKIQGRKPIERMRKATNM